MNNEQLTPELHAMREDIRTNHNKGVIELSDYAGSDLNLSDWTMTKVIDDVLLVEYADGDSQNKMSGGIMIPTQITTATWRIGKVMLSGPNATVSPGQYVMFPSDKGLKAKNVNNRKEVVFLNEARIFGVVTPNSK